MAFKILPLIVIEYLGDNMVTIKNDLLPHTDSAPRPLLSASEYEKWKQLASREQGIVIYRELMTLKNVVALPEASFRERRGEAYEPLRVNIVLPKEFWEGELRSYLFNYVGQSNARADQKCQFHFKGMPEILNPDVHLLVCLAYREDPTVSTEDNTQENRKAVFLKKLADYIGDQDIDHITITTKAGAKIRVDA